jgi:hypothetical protein
VSNTDVLGVVYEATTTAVSLVSLTGNRMVVPVQSFLNRWEFRDPPRMNIISCARMGCARPGLLTYVKDGRPEYCCPRHSAMGVQASLTRDTGSSHTQSPVVGYTCPGCGFSETIENLFEDSLTCPQCSTRFVTTLINQGSQCLIPIIDQIFMAINHIEQRLQTEPRSIVVGNDVYNMLRNEHRVVSSLGEQALTTIGDATLTIGDATLTVRSYAAPLTAYFILPRYSRPAPRVERQQIRETLTRTWVMREVAVRSEMGVKPEDKTLTMIETGSQWVQKGTGKIVYVVEYVGAQTNPDAAVHFKTPADVGVMILTAKDFRTLYRLHESKPNVTLAPACQVGEEWEDPDGSVWKVTAVDNLRCRIVRLGDPGVWLNGTDFNSRFTKLDRGSAWALLLKDDD